MKLKALLRGIDVVVKGSKEVELTGLSSDSKTVAPGNLFLAKRGSSADGAQFIPQAIRSGAHVIVTDLYDPSCPATQVIVEKPGEWEAKLAARYYGAPSKELFVVGTTGSKGKTTTSYLIWHLLGGGLISTAETILGQERRNSTFTTHFPIQNQKILKEILSKGCQTVSMEVSSHGLEQNRVAEIDFDAALWTNLYPDHLDFHGTVECYARAKKKLFALLDSSKKKKKLALLNQDSSWFSFMKEGISSPIWTFGIDQKADIQATGVQLGENSSSFQLEFQGKKQRIELPLIGRFNLYNALGAIGIALFRDMSLEMIAERLSSFSGAPGRLEEVKNTLGIFVFVDYAHTGEALENVLISLREVASRRILCVFGCGGGRDPGRRSGMGAVADRLADISIVTSDNPRNEDPESIIGQIVASFRDPKKAIVEPDRRAAIERAIQMAEVGDVVLIAGKGHEKIQIFGAQTIPFDDVAVANEALQKVPKSEILHDLI